MEGVTSAPWFQVSFLALCCFGAGCVAVSCISSCVLQLLFLCCPGSVATCTYRKGQESGICRTPPERGSDSHSCFVGCPVKKDLGCTKV